MDERQARQRIENLVDSNVANCGLPGVRGHQKIRPGMYIVHHYDNFVSFAWMYDDCAFYAKTLNDSNFVGVHAGFKAEFIQWLNRYQSINSKFDEMQQLSLNILNFEEFDFQHGLLYVDLIEVWHLHPLLSGLNSILEAKRQSCKVLSDGETAIAFDPTTNRAISIPFKKVSELVSFLRRLV